MPEGLVTLRISPDTGRLAADGDPDAISETFMADHLPGGAVPGEEDASRSGPDDSTSAEPIF